MTLRRVCAGACGALLVLLLTPGAPGQDAHPNDRKIVFFKKADRETNDEIVKAVTK